MRTYTAEFRLDTQRLPEAGAMSAVQIERDLAFGDGCTRRWERKLPVGGGRALPGHGRLTPEQEKLRWLECRLGICRTEA
ncbi:hypothetical protein ACFLT5_03600 [Chloroflexota bacterium]